MLVERVPCAQIADKGLPTPSVSFGPPRMRDDAATAIDGVFSFSRPDSTPALTPQPSRFLARQPILDARRKVIGYELLFRSGWENCFRGDRDAATRQTLDNCLAMDIESLAGSGLAFVNCTHQALVDKLVTLLPPRTTVIEILETVAPDPQLIRACIELRDMGYKLALDDFVPRPDLQPLVDIASYIKVDLRISDAAMRREIRKMIGGSRAVLLAEKVETQEDFVTALGEGYKYFQGYFFCRPVIVARREIPPNRANYLRLLVELTRSPFNLSEVARIVELEPSLCYRLLRLVNSALWSMRNDITSIRNAIMLVGEDRFRILVSVAASCVLGQDRRSALVSLSLERARFCELVAPLVGENPTEQFMLGLLSLMDALLETPMDSIAKSLPLRGPAKAALLGESNPVSVPLGLTRSFESAAWGTRESTPNDSGVSEETLAHLYMQSVKWASDAVALSH